MNMKVAFIPHSDLERQVIFFPKATLFQIRDRTGAEHAEFHHHTETCTCRCCGKPHIVLTNPSMEHAQIARQLGKFFTLKRIYVWTI